ncbi:MAG: hypothetical protein ACRDSE_22505 [Pseudonocardiaceae bacterium]
MSTEIPTTIAEWAPPSCTLPTADRPLRTAEFEDLFSTAVRSVSRPEPGRLRLDLDPDPEVAAKAADLMVRETQCCGFFAFAVRATVGELRMDVTVSAAHLDVLDAVAAHAAAASATTL